VVGHAAPLVFRSISQMHDLQLDDGIPFRGVSGEGRRSWTGEGGEKSTSALPLGSASRP